MSSGGLRDIDAYTAGEVGSATAEHSKRLGRM